MLNDLFGSDLFGRIPFGGEPDIEAWQDTSETDSAMRLHTPRSLGKITVTTPGTPVQITTDTTLRATIIRFSVFLGGTGKVYLGVQGMNRATGAGVIKEFWPTTATGGIADEMILEAPITGSNSFFRLSDFYVDADVANEGLLVSYFVKEPDRL